MAKKTKYKRRIVDKYTPSGYTKQIRMPLEKVDWINETGGTIIITGKFANGKKADIRINFKSNSYKKIKNKLRGKKKGTAIMGTKHGNVKVDSFNYTPSSLKGVWFSSSKVYSSLGEYRVKNPRILD